MHFILHEIHVTFWVYCFNNQNEKCNNLRFSELHDRVLTLFIRRLFVPIYKKHECRRCRHLPKPRMSRRRERKNKIIAWESAFVHTHNEHHAETQIVNVSLVKAAEARLSSKPQSLKTSSNMHFNCTFHPCICCAIFYCNAPATVHYVCQYYYRSDCVF